MSSRSVQNAPVLPSCSPRVFWQVAPCLAVSPSRGWRGAGFQALGQAGEGSPGEARLRLFSPPLERRWKEGDPGCRQGSPDLGMERGSETFSLWQLLKHPLLRECRSQLTPGLPATPPSSLIPSCSHLALNLGSGARR